MSLPLLPSCADVYYYNAPVLQQTFECGTLTCFNTALLYARLRLSPAGG